MTSEVSSSYDLTDHQDYIHACDRLSLLKFTETQQREFVRVALHCCATEKTYNPYHSLIINHLCAESYSHRFTLQYALWDFLRELGDDAGKAAKLRCANVAQMSAYVVGRRSLDITVFKVSSCMKITYIRRSTLSASNL